MSISGILSNSYSNNQIASSGAAYQPVSAGFQQLGQDLTSGNLSAAQSDFATLQQAFAQSGTSAATTSTSTSASTASNPLAQAFQQLSTDLQSGNISAAKQDYTTIQNDLKNQLSTGMGHFHHRSKAVGSPEQNILLQDLMQSSQGTSSTSAQSSTATNALQAYASLQQDLQQSMLGSYQSAAATLGSDPISLMA